MLGSFSWGAESDQAVGAQISKTLAYPALFNYAFKFVSFQLNFVVLPAAGHHLLLHLNPPYALHLPPRPFHHVILPTGRSGALYHQHQLIPSGSESPFNSLNKLWCYDTLINFSQYKFLVEPICSDLYPIFNIKYNFHKLNLAFGPHFLWDLALVFAPLTWPLTDDG